MLQLRFFSFFLLVDRHAASCALLLLWQVQLLKEKKAKADEELTGTPRTKESVAAEGWLKDLGVWEWAVEKWPNMSRHKRPLSAPPDPLNLGGSRVAQLRRAHAGESHVRDAGAGSPTPSLVTEGAGRSSCACMIVTVYDAAQKSARAVIEQAYGVLKGTYLWLL